MATTTTTVYHLLAVTDELAARTHLGATEKANRTWCGVDLLAKGDPRFGSRYKDGTGFTASTDLSLVDCRACQRTAAWKVTAATGVATIGIATYTVPASPATGQAKPPTRKRPSAVTRAAAKAAADAVSGESVIEADPETGLPCVKPEVQAKADQIVADQLAAKRTAKDAG